MRLNVPGNAYNAYLTDALARINRPDTPTMQQFPQDLSGAIGHQDIPVTDQLDGLRSAYVIHHWVSEFLLRELTGDPKAPIQGQRKIVTERGPMLGTADADLLEDALVDLKASPDEAKDERMPIPSSKALQNGEHVLRAVYRMWPRRFEVYPMPNGEIAIDAPTGPDRSILILCDSEGGALCSVNFNRTHRRAYYSDARVLPDGFLRDAIADMTTDV